MFCSISTFDLDWSLGKDVGALLSNVGSAAAASGPVGGGTGGPSGDAGTQEAAKEEKEEKQEEPEEESDDDMGFGESFYSHLSSSNHGYLSLITASFMPI